MSDDLSEFTRFPTPQDFSAFQQMMLRIPYIDIMVELNPGLGDTTVEFARKFKRVFAIGLWKPTNDIVVNAAVENEFDKAISSFSNVTKLKVHTVEGLSQFLDDSIHFVYVGGYKSSYGETRQNIINWLPKIKKNWFIGGNQYQRISRIPQAPSDVSKAIEELLYPIHQKFADGSFLKKKGVY